MRRLLALALLLAAPLAAADYPVVYVRAPRDPAVGPLLPEVVFATVMDSGADLVRLDPNGAQTVLYDCDQTCSVTDPSVSLDGQRVYFGLVHGPSSSYRGRVPINGCSIYSLPAAGLEPATPIIAASAGYTAGLPAGYVPPVKPCHLAPQELPGGRLAFSSTLWAQEPPKTDLNMPSMQLFVRQPSGEIEPIAPMTIGSALHPVLLTSGELMFSSLESQGHRDSRLWALWSIYPDGRKWAPLVSAFQDFAAFHFQAQRSSGGIAVVDYYNLNNWGFGTLLDVPWPRPVPAFHSASERPCLQSGFGCFGLPFSPIGGSTLTPWTIPEDRPAPCPSSNPTCAAADRVGKVTHPAAYPGDRLLVTWSGGPVTQNSSTSPILPVPDTGAYLTPAGGRTTSPSQLQLVVNDPAYNEYFARAVVPYATLYGQQPVDLPWLPPSGSPHLPPGSPFGLVGSASVFVQHTESAPGRGSAAYGGLDIFNSTENLDIGGHNWVTQGGDTSLYTNADVAAMRIVLLEPNRIGAPVLKHFANERHRVLAGNGPCGDFPIELDGSFLVRVPADTPFTFQKISTRCESLTMAQTWHQVRPGEIRVDCGGCHYHSHQPIPWAGSLAAQHPPSIPTGVRNVTWLNRIAALVGRIQGTLRGVALGSLAPDAAFKCIADDRSGECSPSQLPSGTWRQTNASAFGNRYRARRSLLWWEATGGRRDGHTNADHPATGNTGDLDYTDALNWSPPLTTQEQRDLAEWIDVGMPYGEPAWNLDTARPVVHVEEPRPGEYVNVQRLLYGVADGNSGVASITVTASWAVAGRAAGTNLHDLARPAGEGIWELVLDGGACPSGTCAQVLTVTALDHGGNPRKVERKITRRSTIATPTPPPGLPTPTRTPTPLATPSRTATANPLATLDADGDGELQALTDGVLVLRYVFGLRGAALTASSVDTGDCTRCTAVAIEAYMASIRTQLDVDGDAEIEPLTDCLLILRYLLAFRGNALLVGAVDTSHCTRCNATAIQGYLAGLV